MPFRSIDSYLILFKPLKLFYLEEENVAFERELSKKCVGESFSFKGSKTAFNKRPDEDFKTLLVSAIS